MQPGGFFGCNWSFNREFLVASGDATEKKISGSLDLLICDSFQLQGELQLKFNDII
jgi:hypothetical protein